MDYCTSAHVDLSKDVQPHLCRFAAQRQSPVQKQFSTHHVQRRMLKPGCQIVGSVTSDKVTTVADSQECRAFSVAGPMAWNSLPNFFRDPTSSADWCRHLLKMYLFAHYWCIQRFRGSNDYALYKSTRHISFRLDDAISALRGLIDAVWTIRCDFGMLHYIEMDGDVLLCIWQEPSRRSARIASSGVTATTGGKQLHLPMRFSCPFLWSLN